VELITPVKRKTHTITPVTKAVKTTENERERKETKITAVRIGTGLVTPVRIQTHKKHAREREERKKKNAHRG